MEEEFLSSDLLLNNVFIQVQAEIQQEELNCLQQDTDTEPMQVLSPGEEDQDYFHDINKQCLDRGGGSKAFTDFNNWQLHLGQYAQKATSSGDNKQPSFNDSEWQESLSINLRDPNTSPRELGINFIGGDLPENIFSNQPISQFIPGKVSYTKEDCLMEFLHQLQATSETQGCVLDEELSVGDGQYSEGKHMCRVASLYQGAFGEVDRCQDFLSGHEFIRKKIALDKFRTTEVLFPLSMKHANIMKICGLIQRVEVNGGSNVMEILMDNAGISLIEFVRNLPESETLSQTLIWDLTKQALEGLDMLHRKRIIHFDIKPENLCVQIDNKGSFALTITDFGSAKKADQQVDFVGWTPEYMAPESCQCYLQHSLKKRVVSDTNSQLTGKVDVFALGLTVLFLHQKKHVLLNLVTGGRNSYNGFQLEKKKLLQLKLMIYLATEKDPVHHLISDECSMDMRDLQSRMLSGTADERPTAGEALAYMKLNECVEKTSQPTAPKPDFLYHGRGITRGKHSSSHQESYHFTTDKGHLVTQPSCSSSKYTPMMAEVPVSRQNLSKSFNGLPEKRVGPIKDHTLKQKLREKLKRPYLKGKVMVQKETEVKTKMDNPTPMDVKSPYWASPQSPASYKQFVAMDTYMDVKESGVMEMGCNITQQLVEQLGNTLVPQHQDTKPIQPSSPIDQGCNVMHSCGNIPNFDAMN
ncbi:hypothetical protein CHS0354_031505 [Potamilus streckersoni]|uniref:Protein kinase domain-containing protein n=1 Tax=Potamilus streckersoni TaxID=2493646 RepID=A0AAE0SHF7_9BIVA|nr:hypothetical protein CHS0354_031505 [Potamilus streckersoni]